MYMKHWRYKYQYLTCKYIYILKNASYILTWLWYKIPSPLDVLLVPQLLQNDCKTIWESFSSALQLVSISEMKDNLLCDPNAVVKMLIVSSKGKAMLIWSGKHSRAICFTSKGLNVCSVRIKIFFLLFYFLSV